MLLVELFNDYSLLFLLSMSTSMALMDASHLTSVPAMVNMVEGGRKQGMYL